MDPLSGIVLGAAALVAWVGLLLFLQVVVEAIGVERVMAWLGLDEDRER